MNAPSTSTVAHTSDPSLRAFAIKVLGVGGAGGNALNYLARESLLGMEFAALNTDAVALSKSNVAHRIVLGAKSSRGLGAGGDPERGRQAAEEDIEPIRALCAGADVVFVVAGLGGGTGTGAGPVVAQAAKDAGALVLSIVMLPFDCEGVRRQHQAEQGLAALKAASDGVICLPNQKVFKFIDEKTSLLEAFTIINELIGQGVRGIWRLLSRPGLINVDFADLCSVARGRHSESALINVECRGEHRVREAIDRIMAHPLAEEGQVLARARGLLVCLAGGPELSMNDVERIMEQIRRQAEQAHVIMGTAVDAELTDRLAVTIVASCHGENEPPESVEPEVDGDMPVDAAAEPARRPAAAQAGTGWAEAVDELEKHLVDTSAPSRGASRYVPPPPDLTEDRARQWYQQSLGAGRRQRRTGAKMRQGQLPLEIVSKGRFEKSEPTIHRGEDLDVPTYIRRGVALN